MKKSLLALSLLLLLTACTPQVAEPTPSPTPAVTAAPTATPAAEPLLYTGERGEFDLTDLALGVVHVRYLGESAKMKVQITYENEVNYNYDLHTAEVFETFPLTLGDGTYTVKLLEHIDGDRYAVRERYALTLSLSDPLAPFLRSNQIVRYSADGGVAEKAAQLTAGLSDPVARIEALFDYATDCITYDYDNPEALAVGYLPDVERILERGRGTCYDYAALLCAMLRLQGIPCRLVTGDIHPDELYHAWVEVWSDTDGTVDGVFPITAHAWSRLDPTFVSTKERSESIIAYVTDDSHYTPRYYF